VIQERALIDDDLLKKVFTIEGRSSMGGDLDCAHWLPACRIESI
jgi:hypothetical protein